MIFAVYTDALASNTMYKQISLLSPHADWHAVDMSFTACCFFHCLFVSKFFGNRYLRRGLTQRDEI